ncbi:MAG: EAL domain-containing protein [Pseudomonadota bacterium]|nr:EAL domain-containing protein [Pseudomonadota bacterium]
MNWLHKLNPFVIKPGSKDPAIVRYLALEYVRREVPMTYSAQAGGLVLLVIGASLAHPWVLALGVLRLVVDGTSRWFMRRFRRALEDGGSPDHLLRWRKPGYFLIGFTWGMVGWPAYLSPAAQIQSSLLVGISLLSMVIMMASVCYIPALFTMTTLGFTLAFLPVLVLVDKVPLVVLLIGIPVLQFMLWDLARHNHTTLSNMLEMQVERDLALVEQKAVISALDDSRQQATRLALSDVLTGLPNRLGFLERIDALINTPDARFQLLLLDLDHFKNINDTLGHNAGDALLIEAARVLEDGGAAGGKPHYVARLGGDEFAVILHDDQDDHYADGLHKRWLSTFSQVQLPKFGRFSGSLTCGAAQWPKDGADRASLLHAADMALRKAKVIRRGSFLDFDAQMVDVFERETSIANLLAGSIEEQLFVFHLQPQVDIRDGRIIGAEILTRFTDLELAKFPVQLVFDVAEERGLGQRLATVLLDRSAETVMELQPYMKRRVPIAINLSPSTLRNPAGLLDQLAGLMARGLRPDMIKLEITEDAISGRGLETVGDAMSQIAGLGFALSLDDFGTGQSALAHLHSLPIHEIKIAKRFVDPIAQGGRTLDLVRKDEAIVRATLNLSRQLGMRCVLEGVETREQAECLQAMGAEIAQGYYWARPMPVMDFMEMLRRNVEQTGKIDVFAEKSPCVAR